MSKTFILHNNNAKLLTKWQKKNCPINNQVTYPFFLNKFIDVSESKWISPIIFTFLKKKIEAVTVQLFIQSSQNSVYVIWKIITEIYPKFITVHWFFKVVRKIEQIYMESGKSIIHLKFEKNNR